MADPKGHKLYVNVSAAEARRRLERFGHGVRKVHSGGRNRAVVIHTATGIHLAELEGKFADVGCSRSELPSRDASTDEAETADQADSDADVVL
jgi:hypothetical protein